MHKDFSLTYSYLMATTSIRFSLIKTLFHAGETSEKPFNGMMTATKQVIFGKVGN